MVAIYQNPYCGTGLLVPGKDEDVDEESLGVTRAFLPGSVGAHVGCVALDGLAHCHHVGNQDPFRGMGLVGSARTAQQNKSTKCHTRSVA
jgi:hypothetical protein